MKKSMILVPLVVLLLVASVSADVVINEIMADPSAVGDAVGEYIELYNYDNNPVDIGGWSIDGDVIAGPLVIPAGGYLTLCRNADPLLNGGVSCNYIASFALVNPGDTITLLDNFGAPADEVTYDDGVTFPPTPTGASLELIHPSLDNDEGTNWEEAINPFGAGDLGTPGAPNDNEAPEVTITSSPDILNQGQDVLICAEAIDTSAVTDFLFDCGASNRFHVDGLMYLDNGEYCVEISAGSIGSGRPVPDTTTVNCEIFAVDEFGNTGSVTAPVITYDGRTPSAVIIVPPCDEGSISILDASSSSDTVTEPANLKFTWDLDEDGVYELDTGHTPTADFNCVDDTGDSFDVSVRVTDEAGHSSTVGSVVSVNNVAPVVTAPAGTNAQENTAVTIGNVMFTDVGIPDTHSTSIDWGDGSLPIVIDPSVSPIIGLTYTYAAQGIYTVTITVTDDDGGVHSDTLEIIVGNAIPVVVAPADTSTEEGSLVTIGETTFTDASTGPETHTAMIDWGDGNVDDLGIVTSPIAPQSHTYADEGTGTYIVTITVDDGADSGSDATTVTVTNAAPVVIAPAGENAAEGFPVTIGEIIFTDAGADDTHNGIIDWGDENIENSAVPITSPIGGLTHQYDVDGTYTVTITVTDNDGGIGSDTLIITVSDYAIQLEAGWNMISLALVPEGDDTAVESVLADVLSDVLSVWSYQEDEWLFYRGQPDDTLTEMVPGYGYFIQMTDGAELYLDGERMFFEDDPAQPSAPPSVILTPGWNLIGHYGQTLGLARDDALETLEGFAATLLGLDGGSVDTLFPGQGYWLFITGLNNAEYAPSDAAYP